MDTDAEAKKAGGNLFWLAAIVVIAIGVWAFFKERSNQQEAERAMQQAEMAAAHAEAQLGALPESQAARVREAVAALRLKIVLRDGVGASQAARNLENVLRGQGGRQGGNYPGDQEVFGPEFPR